jgi:hypothetical protein
MHWLAGSRCLLEDGDVEAASRELTCRTARPGRSDDGNVVHRWFVAGYPNARFDRD